ncbi:MAG: hypothetical protein PHC97_00860 [Patescibacteria group bacterium]|nr:hypothetical protein [Patescibacteria group bacterium]
MIGLGLSQSLRQTKKLATSLTLQQSAIQSQQLSLRLELVEQLGGERYQPKAHCPACGRELTPTEIIRGFSHDINDFDTTCSGCGHRFQPTIICFGHGTEVELPFFCDCQTLHKMEGLQHLSPQEISKKEPAVYRSAIVHHGGLKSAFAKNNIDYPFQEIHDWKSKVTPFLGRMQDTVIAECCQVSTSTIRALRKKLKISRFTLKVALAEIKA